MIVAGLVLLLLGAATHVVFVVRLGALILTLGVILYGLRALGRATGGDDFRGPEAE